MACFLISTAEAIVVTALKKHTKTKEVKQIHVTPAKESGMETSAEEVTDLAHETHKVPFSQKLGWLSNMLWGGSALLAFEHFWHGEIIPTFPFLSAMSNSADTAEMLHEISTVGVGMAALVTAVWGVMCVISDKITKQHDEPVEKVETSDAR